MQLIDGRPVYAATDLVGFLACNHLLALERAALAGLVERPIRDDPEIDLIARRGLAHEKRYLAELRSDGRSIREIERDGSAATDSDGLRAAADATVAALRTGVDVVYQATFFDGRWRGHADFLLRVERPSDLGDWSYEVADTKLARRTKASAILQICSYVEQLTRLQGVEPATLHVALGGSAHQIDSYRVADFMAYYRHVKAEFETAVAAGDPVYPVTATYPDPVEHCDVCRWAIHCRDQRRRDDDLSLVAGITARQRRGLKERGIRTRRGLGGLALPMVPRLERTNAPALERVRDQARIQVEGEDERRPKWEFLELERNAEARPVPDRGLLVLPEPSANDLFFDIEGDPFAFDDGVDYLFGVLEPARPDEANPTRPRFHEIWSRDPTGEVTLAAEKRAFENVVDLIINRLDADPTLHVYHYAAYERTALGRLAQRHGTREREVDRLLRGGVLVDLYRVVRQAIRASVESYSIKRLEPLYGLEREVELRSASSSIVQFEVWLEGGTSEDGHVGEEILREIAGYNRDDVVSNWRLRDWLEARRTQLETELGEDLGRPGVHEEAIAPKEPKEREILVEALVARLTRDLPEDPLVRSRDENATWLLAQLLGWHRREEKAFWWRYYQLCGMTDEDLVDEREPIGDVVLVENLAPRGKAGLLQRFRYPLQDHSLKVGRNVDDPRTEKSCGTIAAIDDVELTIDLARSAGQIERGLPHSLIPNDFVKTDEQQDSLIRLAGWVAEQGVAAEGSYRAGRELLLRLPPQTGQAADGALRRADEDALSAARRMALAMREGTLPIQGPPGSGKTYTGARMIVALVAAGRKVGVTATTHKVIGHLLDEIHEAADEAGVDVRIGQKHGQNEAVTCTWAVPIDTNPAAAGALEEGLVNVLGATSWLWSRPELEGSVDVLVIDEAGQMSLANTLAVAPAAESLILLGDPQQLEQPVRGSHPPGAERSSLGHLLDGRPTIAEDAGLFLDRTWRLHPDVCAYTSEVFYASQLQPEPTLARQALRGVPPADGTGMRWLPIDHDGNATDSPEEAATIARLVGELLEVEASWTTRKGEIRPITLSDILVVAPYNAHVELIAEALAKAGHRGARVGTVDKYQGQEAAISIYAMGSSSVEDAPRGMEFLYSLNRLNVATSRARCAAIVVASPALVRVQCHTPRQMQLANALCRLVEVATVEAANEADRPATAAPPAAEAVLMSAATGGVPGELSEADGPARQLEMWS